MKANALLKRNIDTLLKARGQTRRELAAWVRQSVNLRKVDPLGKIFTEPDREFQAKYLDRIAEFFGLAVYQLFQPGISPLTERRGGSALEALLADHRAARVPAGPVTIRSMYGLSNPQPTYRPSKVNGLSATTR